MKNIFKPMLYQTEMVEAILDDRKNQTRRTKGLEKINESPDQWSFGGWESHNNLMNAFFWVKGTATCDYAKSPYQVEDILWVRETWNNWDTAFAPFVYKATDLKSCGHNWKPSIHMPKKAARIFLKVKSVKVERLLDITKEDAIQEGVKWEIIDGIKEYKNYIRLSKEFSRWNDFSYPDSPVSSFISLWERINGNESLGLNPWVWVIEFERIDKPEDFI